MLDEIDVDEGLAHEEQTNGDWTETSFEDAEDIPPFDHEWGANVAYMQENSCSSCLDSFTCFFDDECLCTFVTATNNFGSQHFGSKWKPLDVNEFKTFLAAILVLGLIPVSSRDSAWGDNGLGIPLVKNLITKARFNQILRAWRYEDESGLTGEQINRNVKQSPFWYVKGFVDSLRDRFQKMYKLGQNVDIDEQCIPWKGRHISRCYNPNKPEKWHFKCFALNCSLTGYMINVYLYEGSAENRPMNVPATLYPIQKLFEPIGNYYDKGHIVATDNWYTSKQALLFVRDTLRNHYVGTCKANKKDIPKDGLFQKVGRGKKKRGACKQMVITENGKNAYFVAWQDNKPVHILSTIKSGLHECQRRIQNETTRRWERITYPQPSIIKTYNSAMGGTDSFDQRLSYFRPALKTRRYLARVFTHFLSASVVNAFIIHRQYHNTSNTFQLRPFIEKLIFELVPQVDLFAPRGIAPIFKRRLAQWEQDRTRLNTNVIHAPFIEELSDATSNNKHVIFI